MCGIGGWIGRCREDPAAVAGKLAHAMRHRGPDDRGHVIWDGGGLVHTRLSIIDCTATGRQPMANETGTVWTTFNGEIYNHRSLRAHLQSRQHQFIGRSDTEVIPHLYEEKGIRFIDDLRGMFALAVFDRTEQRLLLARDRYGIKPMYYAPFEDGLVFASEINALKGLTGVDLTLDYQALSDYSTLFFIPAPATAYRGVRALEAGRTLEAWLEGGRLQLRLSHSHRWRLAPDFSTNMQRATDNADNAEALLLNAVSTQLESDVPLGVLLSGGIDSSLISAAAQAHSKLPIHTFNAKFESADYDETPAALAASRHLQTRHRVLIMHEFPGRWDRIARTLEAVGQPFADSSIFGVSLVCQAIRSEMTVALAGDGGDEGFGGYDTYWQVARLDHLLRMPRCIRRLMATAASPAVQVGLLPSQLIGALRQSGRGNEVDSVQALLTWIRSTEWRQLWNGPPVEPVDRLFEPRWEVDLPVSASRHERLAAIVTEALVRLILPGDYLTKVDTASMQHGLEVRVPMLDEQLFELGLNLPIGLKVNGRTGKLVLRQVARRYLPTEVAEKKKHGFGVPVHEWVTYECRRQIREELTSTHSPLASLFSRTLYTKWLDCFRERKVPTGMTHEGLYQRVIMLLSTHLTLSACTSARERPTDTVVRPPVAAARPRGPSMWAADGEQH